MKRICNESRLQDSENANVVIPAGSIIFFPNEAEAVEKAILYRVECKKIEKETAKNTNFKNNSSKAEPEKVKA